MGADGGVGSVGGACLVYEEVEPWRFGAVRAKLWVVDLGGDWRGRWRERP